VTAPPAPRGASLVPDSWEQWRHCIEVDCRLALTPAFVAERRAELGDPSHFRTRQFIALYGDAHRLNVLAWFQRAAAQGGAGT